MFVRVFVNDYIDISALIMEIIFLVLKLRSHIMFYKQTGKTIIIKILKQGSKHNSSEAKHFIVHKKGDKF